MCLVSVWLTSCPTWVIIIIIITNEKIKVMLSQKRCRGTLQDYTKGEISKCQSKLWTKLLFTKVGRMYCMISDAVRTLQFTFQFMLINSVFGYSMH